MMENLSAFGRVPRERRLAGWLQMYGTKKKFVFAVFAQYIRGAMNKMMKHTKRIKKHLSNREGS